MTVPVGRWRASYTPGNWIVLAGPTSVVVLEPPTQQWSALVPSLWTEVVESASLVDLASQLAGYRIDTMPSFAAFFWTEQGMRSLVRGAVRVLDPSNGSVVATGDGIQTWSEVGLDGLSQVRVELPAAVPDASGPALSLPLVVGAVRASAVLLDTSDPALVFSPQARPGEFVPAEPDASEPEPQVADEGELEGPITELMTDPFSEVQTEPEPEPPVVPEEPAEPEPADGDADRSDSIENGDTQLVMPPVPPEPTQPPPASGDSMIMAVVCEYGHSSPPNATTCRVCGRPIASQGPRLVPRPALALLRASDGTTVEVDRAVLLGRAPSAGMSTARTPRLMTVPSPGHDISRTHVEVAVDGWQVLVTDLQSTNGTILVRPGSGDREHLPPGEAVPVPLQSLLELGDGVSVLIDFPQ